MRSTILLLVMMLYIALQVPALNSEDMADVTEVGSIIVNNCVMLFKLFHIRIYYKRYDSMMKGMKELCLEYGREFPHFKPFLQKSERQLRVITVALLALVGTVCFTWAVLPAVRPGILHIILFKILDVMFHSCLLIDSTTLNENTCSVMVNPHNILHSQ